VIRGIHDLTMHQFANELNSVASHSAPIDRVNHLKGRSEQVGIVRQAIYTKGQHVFIFGERGVGKTSLAKTAGLATIVHENFKQFGCNSQSTFDSIIRPVVEAFAPQKLAEIQKKSGLGINHIITAGASKQETYAAQTRLDVSWTADVLASLDNDLKNTIRVVVIDEVDRIRSKDALRDLAELVKLLGDRGALITFIFTGVGADLDEILGAHQSSFRQFAQVKLERIAFQAALDIIDDVLERFGLKWDQEPTRTARFRVASIANGFPYYVHLVVAKLLYAIYDDKAAEEPTLDHLRSAITAAVAGAQEEIRKPYDRAIRGRNETYKHAVWATADSWELERTTSHIYASYQGLCERLDATPVDQRRLVQRLNTLKRDTHGPLLTKAFRAGQYKFCENIIRGYVRLCASAEGIELQDLSPQDTTAVVHSTVRYQRYRPVTSRAATSR
jgi:uncharacterized protein